MRFLDFIRIFLFSLIFSWHVYNGFLDFLMGVSYVFVSMIMDRSLRFHLNLDCLIFVLAISQSRACCMYRNVYSIQTCEITIILFRSSP